MSKLRPEYVRKEYDKAAEEHEDGYEQWRWKSKGGRKSDYRRTYECIKHHLGSRRFKRMLEIGCGPGTWTGLLADRSESIDLIDISRGMLARARKRLGDRNVRYIAGDFQRHRFPKSRRYDGIASFRALEYMDDKELVVKKIHGLLEEGGMALIITKNPLRELRKRVPLLKYLSKAPPLHTNQISHTDLVSLFRKAGFRDIRVHPVLIHPFIVFRTRFHDRISERIYGKGCELPMRRKRSRLMESYLIKARR